MLKGPASSELTALRQAWIDRWPALDAAYVNDLDWSETNLLHDQHNALADSVARHQLTVRKIVAEDVWYIMTLAAAAFIAAILLALKSSVSLLGYVVTTTILLSGGYAMRSRRLLAEVAATVILAALIIAFTVLLSQPGFQSTATHDLTYGMVAGASLWGSIIVIARFILAKWSARMIKSEIRKHPIENVVTELLLVADWLSGPVEDFLQQDRRRFAATALLRCSHAMKVGLVHLLDPPSPTMRALVGTRLGHAAETVHGYVAWILLPNQSTREELRRRCLISVAAVELREFDLLPAEPAHITTKGQAMRILGEYIKRIALILLAPGAVYLVYKTGHLADPALFANAIWFAAVWIAVNLGHLLDPQINTKITAVKDAVTILHPTPAPTPKK